VFNGYKSFLGFLLNDKENKENNGKKKLFPVLSLKIKVIIFIILVILFIITNYIKPISRISTQQNINIINTDLVHE